MTVYNAARYVRAAIDSILIQTFTEFEFIIVDNCSSDRTVEIIESYGDKRIILIKNNENVGQTKALNIGLQESSGNYIARMDADDVCVPERLQLQYDFLEEHPEIAVVGSSWIYINDEGRELRTYHTLTDPVDIRCALVASGDLTSWCMPHPVILARKKVLADVGFYTEEAKYNYPQDYDLWSKLLVKDYQFANIRQPLLKYRILESSESRGLKDNQLLEYRCKITSRKIKAFLPEIKTFDDLVLMLEFRPQRSFEAGERIFYLFDQYFDGVMKKSRDVKKLSVWKKKIKLYYIPQLLKTNKFLSIKYMLCVLFTDPALFLNGRFLRKLVKCYFPNRINQKLYYK